MWLPFTLPEPHDARARAKLLQRQSDTAPSIHPSTGAAPSLATQSARGPLAATAGLAEPGDADRWNFFSTARARKQFSIFAAGAAFFVLSTIVTRRSITRRIAAIRPEGTFSPSNQVPDANGPLDAANALGLATLNVTSFAVMATGGTMWSLDISNIEDLRRMVRKGMDIDGVGRTPEQAEDDIEEWMAVVMARMSGKSDQDIAEMVKQAAEKGDSKKAGIVTASASR